MSIATRTMYQELDALRDQMSRFFREISNGEHKIGVAAIDLDIQETDDVIVVKATVPGIKAEDLAVEVRNGVLTIQGESHEEHEETEGTWHRRERHVGRVYRAATLPTEVNGAQAESTLHDGVLEIHLPKADTSDRHRIPVTTD